MSIDRSQQNANPAEHTDPLNADVLSTLLPITPAASDTLGNADSFLSRSTSGQDSAQISKLGQLFSKLQSLASHDPAKFTQVTAHFAAKIKKEAAQLNGPQAQFLSKLADKFSQASQSGDLAALKPAAASHGKVPAAYSTGSTDALSTALSGSLFHQLDQELSG